MTNDKFLKVEKGLFSLGLDAYEILIVAQILEFQSKGMECYITNETFAEWYGTSVSTIKRRIDNLVGKNIVKRETKNTQKGKDRHLYVILENINNSAKSKMTLPQSSNWSLRKDQNEPIKDNNEKDNNKKDNCKSTNSKVETIVNIVKNSTSSKGEFQF